MTTNVRGPLAAAIGGLTVVIGLVTLVARLPEARHPRPARKDVTTTVEQKTGAATIAWTVLGVLAGMVTVAGACMIVVAGAFADRLVWTQMPVAGGLLVLFGGLIWFFAAFSAYKSVKDDLRA